MTRLMVEDLQIAVRGGMAVDGVSFMLEPGEVLALMGESGAGKSLTATALVGLLPHGSRQRNGRILLDGVRIDQSSPAQWQRLRGKRICAMLQDPSGALDPLQTVGAQVAETLRAHRTQLPSAQLHERVIDWLAAVSLDAIHSHAYPHELSESDRQRAALALALCPAPDVLIADEPAHGKDIALRAQFAALIMKLARSQGSSVLLLSPDLDTALTTADRVAVMYAGRVVETGRTAEVLHHPRHPYVHALIASMPGLTERRSRLPTMAGRMPLPGSAPKGCVFRTACHRATEQCRDERPAQPASGAACFHPLPGLDHV